MPLSCSCEFDDWYPEPGEWYYIGPVDYMPLTRAAPKRKRRPRCWSCKELIDWPDLVVKFERIRVADELQAFIFGDEYEYEIAPRFHCERCGDLYYSIKELGYCGEPGANQLELAKEVAARQKAHRERMKSLGQRP